MVEHLTQEDRRPPRGLAHKASSRALDRTDGDIDPCRRAWPGCALGLCPRTQRLVGPILRPAGPYSRFGGPVSDTLHEQLMQRFMTGAPAL